MENGWGPPPFPATPPLLRDPLERLHVIYDMQSTGPQPEPGLLIFLLLAFQTPLALRCCCEIKTGSTENKVLLMRRSPCVCESAGVSSDLSGVLHFIALTALSWAHVVPSFRLSLGRKLGHAMCQLGNKRYRSWRLLSHSEEVGAVSHLPPRQKKSTSVAWSEHFSAGARFSGSYDGEKLFFPS